MLSVLYFWLVLGFCVVHLRLR